MEEVKQQKKENVPYFLFLTSSSPTLPERAVFIYISLWETAPRLLAGEIIALVFRGSWRPENSTLGRRRCSQCLHGPLLTLSLKEEKSFNSSTSSSYLIFHMGHRTVARTTE